MSNPLVLAKDLFNLTLPVAAAAYTHIVAGGAGNNVQVVGLTIDRESLTPYGAYGTLNNVVPIGALFLVDYECALGAGNTISINAVEVDSSPDGNTWSTLYQQGAANANEIPPDWPLAGVIDTGGTGGTTQRGVVAYGAGIQSAQRYVRFKFTPNLSAASIDTGNFMVAALFSGMGELPPAAI